MAALQAEAGVNERESDTVEELRAQLAAKRALLTPWQCRASQQWPNEGLHVIRRVQRTKEKVPCGRRKGTCQATLAEEEARAQKCRAIPKANGAGAATSTSRLFNQARRDRDLSRLGTAHPCSSWLKLASRKSQAVFYYGDSAVEITVIGSADLGRRWGSWQVQLDRQRP